MRWMVVPYRRYFEFSGRSRRREYWGFFAFTWIVTIVLDALFGTSTYHYVSRALMAGTVISNVDNLPGSLFALANLIPGTAVAVRRLHDVNKTGWWLILLFVPILGWSALFVMLCFNGTRGTNDYGPDPKMPSEASVFA